MEEALATRSNQLGKYLIVAEIARGGMGIVYLAVAQGPARFSKLLVVKELKPELGSDPVFLAMFLEEARLAARLNHPNIVQTYEVGVEGGRHYLVMDYLVGVPLAKILRKSLMRERFTQEMHLRVICEMLRGLHYAHTLKDFDGTSLGMVHRDISPQNVFVTFDGQAKLVDFGIAKAFDSTVETRTGMLKGKPTYMSPEQLGGTVDPRSDVYAAGVMLWEAVAKRRMWRGKGDVEIISNLLRDSLPKLEEVAPDAPPELVRITEKAMAREPDQRYQSGAALLDDLEAYLRVVGDVSMHAVALAVTAQFQAERETTLAAIDRHMTRIKLGAISDVVPTFQPTSQDESLSSGLRPSSVGSLGSLRSLGSIGSLSRPSGTPSAVVHSRVSQLPREANARLLIPAGIGAASAAVVGLFVALALHSFDARDAKTAAAVLQQPAIPPAVLPDAPPPLAVPAAPPITATALVQAPTPPSHRAAPPPAQPQWRGHSAVAAPAGLPPNTAATHDVSQAAAPAASPEVAVVDSERTGYLTIDTYPWTQVSTGGKVLGTTPLVRVQLSVGTHVLSLDNPQENVHQTTVVTIKPNDTVARRLAF